MKIESPFLTIKETALLLKLHPQTVYKLIKRKMIPARKIGGSDRVDREALSRWLNRGWTARDKKNGI